MTKALAAAISALALIQFASPAFAQPSDPTDRRIEHLMRQLMAKAASPNTVVLVTRGANVQVQGTIKIASPIKLPLSCTVFISDDNNHSEVKTTTVTFSGNVGTCKVGIPFKWTNTDPDGTVDMFVVVSNDLGGLFPASAVASGTALRTSELDLAPIPLPEQGTTATATFDIRM